MFDEIYKYIDIMKTIKEPVQSEINIKKSQFICGLYPTKNKKESKEIIQRLNQKYSDATHNCTAYIVGDGEGFDDDGEPGGTAGKPMINVLRKNELHNVTAVVTRYFGGILLGGGGLVRAYSHCASLATEAAGVIYMRGCAICSLDCTYNQYGKLQSLIPEMGGIVDNADFADKVNISFHIPSEELQSLRKKVTDATSGTVEIISEEEKYYPYKN